MVSVGPKSGHPRNAGKEPPCRCEMRSAVCIVLWVCSCACLIWVVPHLGLAVRVWDSDSIRYTFSPHPPKEECRGQKGGALENIHCGRGLSTPFCLPRSHNSHIIAGCEPEEGDIGVWSSWQQPCLRVPREPGRAGK